MKKKDQNLLLLAAAAGGAFWLYKKQQENKPPSTSGAFPGVGAMLPASSSIVPASMRGKCSPLWLDAALWGSAGAGGLFLLYQGKKLPKLF